MDVFSPIERAIVGRNSFYDIHWLSAIPIFQRFLSAKREVGVENGTITDIVCGV